MQQVGKARVARFVFVAALIVLALPLAKVRAAVSPYAGGGSYARGSVLANGTTDYPFVVQSPSPQVAGGSQPELRSEGVARLREAGRIAAGSYAKGSVLTNGTTDYPFVVQSPSPQVGYGSQPELRSEGVARLRDAAKVASSLNTASSASASGNGFDWGDAGIGAGLGALIASIAGLSVGAAVGRGRGRPASA